jgi:hypothetical protein
VIDAGPEPGCSSEINDEPGIIADYQPAAGTSVSKGGQIKVWVQDEAPPIIAPGEQVDPTTGAITVLGDVAAMAPDGYPWEPILYVGGAAHIPSLIKGAFDSDPTGAGLGGWYSGPPVDPDSSVVSGFYVAEYVWNVDSLGLSPGTYDAEFVIHDGDQDRGIGCVTIVIGL